MKILVFGGAGFIGSHLVDTLLAKGHQVRVYDSLDPQVHGESQAIPSYLNPGAEFIQGDVRDSESMKQAMVGMEAVYFLAAAVGVGQSMYEIERYVDVNSMGAAKFLDLLARDRGSIEKVIVASSMSAYGEGAYKRKDGSVVYPLLRPAKQLEKSQWEVLDDSGEILTPIPTAESKPMYPTSVYAITKRDHEELFLAVGAGYDIPVVALRFFNVYGTRQALSNPYTGVAAIFSSLILNKKPPQIFEDGHQTRDFIHVSDIVQALTLSLEKDEANGQVYNVGTGSPVSVLQVAEVLSAKLGFDQAATITNQFRVGDIRHCFSDITKISNELGYAPKIQIEDGFDELTEWVSKQMVDEKVSESTKELADRKLIR